METNVEIVDQDVERVKLKYGDKEIPKEELKKFKVSTCFNSNLFILLKALLNAIWINAVFLFQVF